MKQGCLILLFTLLLGCSDPLPEDRLNYAGEWQSREMGLLILADGSVSYKRLKGGTTVSVNGPVKAFDGDSFEVGLGPLSTRFHVSQPPHKVNGRWQMVVDGVRLTRVDEHN
ncbi:hypothetical protein [Neptuniibacter halophilus]|uniref:hypothetical protein n=1 Tax=Neptuniibacter halophilus TaxID=651666 RepID=UPI002573F950|nr:hypothetical protein [Neptuniibacter halophilus]